jgi:hypothetical protein
MARPELKICPRETETDLYGRRAVRTSGVRAKVARCERDSLPVTGWQHMSPEITILLVTHGDGALPAVLMSRKVLDGEPRQWLLLLAANQGSFRAVQTVPGEANASHSLQMQV